MLQPLNSISDMGAGRFYPCPMLFQPLDSTWKVRERTTDSEQLFLRCNWVTVTGGFMTVWDASVFQVRRCSTRTQLWSTIYGNDSYFEIKSARDCWIQYFFLYVNTVHFFSFFIYFCLSHLQVVVISLFNMLLNEIPQISSMLKLAKANKIRITPSIHFW